MVRIRDSGGWHLQTQQLVQAIPWKESKESIESHLLKDRVDLVSHPEKQKLQLSASLRFIY